MHCLFQIHISDNKNRFLYLNYWLSLILTCVICVCWRASARMLATICAYVGDHPRVCSPTNTLKCSLKQGRRTRNIHKDSLSIDYLRFTKSRCWRNLSIVNYDTSYQDPLLARHSSNKFDSALATLRNCELSIVNCELSIGSPAKRLPRGIGCGLLYTHCVVTHWRLIVNCELPIALPAKGWMRNPYIWLFCFFSL